MITPRIVLTLGEPAGIGPDIVLQIANDSFPAEIIVVGSPDLLKERAKLLGRAIDLYDFDPKKAPVANGQGKLAIFPIPLIQPVVPGELNVENSAYVLKTLKEAYQLCHSKQADALVTCPVHKAIIQQSGIPFKGHTEYLAQLAEVKEVLMTFYSPSVIVGLATTHCPLQAVSGLLTKERLTNAIRLLNQGLGQLFQKKYPRIGVCGLNPHAGESGLLGHEENDLIIPVLEELRRQDLNLDGPYPADTIFTQKSRGNFDAILAMYHDQGLAPIKALHFGDTVNMTLGLPFLRTSVDHGTALNIAGTGQADPRSLYKAIGLTIQLMISHSIKEKT